MSKILLVEDNDINRDMLSRRLERKGYEVITAVNGTEGVAKTLSDPPDLVLMDMHMPVLDGWEATRQIKANPQTRAIPVIALTADAIAGEREKALAAGCDEYDIKPVDLPRLLEKIVKLLEPASQPPISQLPEVLSIPSDQRLQRILLTRLRRDLDPPIHRIIGYSDMLLDAPDNSQNPALCSDLQKINASGMQLLRLIHAILNPVLVEIQQQQINLLAPALRLELLTPLSTIIGYCEMLLEEAPAELIPDLKQIHTSAQDLLSQVNSLDSLMAQHLQSIDPLNADRPNTAEKLLEIATAKALAQHTALETHRSPVTENSRILVVDTSENCTLLSRLLERQGSQVTIATTDQQALEAIEALSYDLILLDVSLPEISGLKMLEELKCHPEWQHIPVLIMAAPDQMQSVVQAIAMGAADYLTSPFQSVLLRTKVTACLEQEHRRLAEADLRQQLIALQLELEQIKQAQQVAEIVQTDYFQQLQPNSEAQRGQDSDRQTSLPPKVLLVEDNELNCDMLSRRLQRHSYTVVIANDGAEGVAKALSECPQIILMDISLPVMDGWEATQQLKADPRTCHIPVIALTAHAMTGDREKALAAGCDDYDTKPIALPRLLSKIEECLKRSANP